MIDELTFTISDEPGALHAILQALARELGEGSARRVC
jgi:hypothetical protein